MVLLPSTISSIQLKPPITGKGPALNRATFCEISLFALFQSVSSDEKIDADLMFSRLRKDVAISTKLDRQLPNICAILK